MGIARIDRLTSKSGAEANERAEVREALEVYLSIYSRFVSFKQFIAPLLSMLCYIRLSNLVVRSLTFL
jgi:hypothetical protein